ncbi:phosphoglycerate mutase family protein [Pseudooceanicola batsensis HTCC2597]|uniref:Phosphoglycerate mutase family protein n=1 Tax=Pseudooceanicola batsensis (strain ATCC BAA-863 / DSM 15984 / KCTC 12145 / HTCC2597) TaxID=252305 RepID=A3TVZ8_PSEBH|nr:histidine phosphatase family protein [Pseudooceanicola batsensis]EAQ03794.1 phosphoglycerate mutase family protein [Pseudooceanicola batsensis HTCC2597]
MPTLYLIRHGQASFGADDYDVLSEIGHEQSGALGRWFAQEGIRPDLVAHGTLRRQKETLTGILRGMGLELEPEEHQGFDEYDFGGLLKAKYAAGGAPEGLMTDHKSHFRTLRSTVAEWQRDEIAGPPEMWSDFTGRVDTACRAVMREGVETVFAVSSGGAISQAVSALLETPGVHQTKMQLQMKNTAITRFVFTPRNTYFHGFNETPHITAANADRLLTYA